MSTLEGKSKQDLEVLALQQRDTAQNILDALEKLNGEETGMAKLRADFFTCG